MKLTILFILLFALQLPATITLHGQVSLDVHDKELRDVLKVIEDQSTYRFFYNESFADLSKKINAHIDNKSIGETLDVLLTMSDMSYKVLENNLIVIVPKTKLQQQRVEITGRVTDASSGQTLPGVTIAVKGTTIGTATDVSGTFSLLVPTDATTLVFSFIGMETVEVSITEARMYNVIMNPTIAGLDEFVVTALGISRERKTLGYAVQSISGEDVTIARDPNIFNTLSGQIAGINVTSGGSTVGASSRLVIRGQASLAGNQPLMLVDGTPINTRTSNLDGLGGRDWGSLVADIDPNNIESITVLKGANAAALYGSRATNGVILIQTKKGEKDRGIGLEFNTFTEFNQPAYFYNFQNEYGEGLSGSEHEYQLFLEANPESALSYNDYARQYSYNWVDGMGAGVNDNFGRSWGPRLNAGLLLDQFHGPNTPWVSNPNNMKMDFYQMGMNIENNIAIYSKGENAYGRVSYSRLDQEGIVYNTDQSRNTLNASFTLSPSDRIGTTVNFTYVKTDSDNLPMVGRDWPAWDFFWEAGRQWDIASERKLFEDAGKKNTMTMRGETNNLFYTLHNTSSFNRDRIFGNTSFQYQIMDWLTFSARVGLDYSNETRFNITQSGTWPNIRQNLGGQFNKNQIINRELTADLLLLFDRSFGKFRIDGTVGSSLSNRQGESLGLSALDLTIPDLFTIGNVSGTPGTSMSYSEQEVQSVFGAANLSYQDFIFFGVTGRNDWSSTLPSQNRSYFYPSVSLGFSMTEAFQIESNVLNRAQLRASWAQVGSDTGPYRLLPVYGIATHDGVSRFSPSNTFPSINLKPEITSSIEFGTDLVFLNNRISTDLTYYKQTTTNQILRVPTSGATGYTGMLINAGEIENTGFEVQLLANIITGQRDAFRWQMRANWATNKSMIIELYEGIESYQIGRTAGLGTFAVPGEEWGVLMGLPYVRDDQGRIIVADNGLPATTNVTSKLGKINPDWTGGLGNQLSYKNISLNFLVDFSMGANISSMTAWHSYPTGTLQNSINHPKYGKVREEGLIVDGVHQDGTPNTTRVTAYNYFNGIWRERNHEYAVLDASYVKLRSVVLGYNLPIQRIAPWIRNLNLSLVGRNLAILYRSEGMKEIGLDPDVGLGGGDSGYGFETYQRPTTRTFGFRVSVNF